MRRVVPGFEHHAGRHCGSTAMADALRMVGIDLSEPMALGLGAGPFFFLLEGPAFTPTCSFLGRSVTYEHDLCRRLSVPFEEHGVADFADAWRELRALIDAGKPVLAVTDVRYLPHYETTSHFNGHRIVLAGYTDDSALIADSHFPGLTEVPLASFRDAMVSDAPPLTTTDAIFGVLGPPERPFDLAAAAKDAIHAAATSALDDVPSMGVRGVERLAARLPGWRDAPDWKWRARFAYQVIEKRGCGGGLFRRMHAEFLNEIADRTGEESYRGLALLSVAAADAWTALALELKSASEREAPAFTGAAELAGDVARKERVLWENSITDRVANSHAP